jgi:S1-C subfamily serine protease
MLGSVILDVVLVVLLVAYLVYGYQTGLVRSLSGILGVAVGGFVAVLLVPKVSSWVQDPGLRTAATIAVVVALVVGGHWGGAAIGNAIQRRMRRRSLNQVNRVLGAIVTTIVAALIASMLAASIGALGVPTLSQAIASSRVLRAINGVTPEPVQAFLAQVRSATVDESLPRIAQALGTHTASQNIPAVDTTTAALRTAAQSVVRITGNAYACGQSQSGSGFVVTNERIVTNAHVVAGVANPVVDLPGGGALRSTVVYFDPVGDLAVLEVPGLSLRPLPLTTTQPLGTHAVSDGYPFGGPFVSLPVGVSDVSTINVQDIYGSSSAPRQVYTLAANVQEGDSGGPLLTTGGQVAGIIFAKGATTPNLGYAITMQSLAPVAERAHLLNATVSSGRCTRG